MVAGSKPYGPVSIDKSEDVNINYLNVPILERTILQRMPGQLKASPGGMGYQTDFEFEILKLENLAFNIEKI